MSRISAVQETPSERSIAFRLPPTWRQIKRIMASGFVVIFAFSHDEITVTEASRYMAMVGLLLDHLRCRWGNGLDNAVRSVTDMCHLTGVRLTESMKYLNLEISGGVPQAAAPSQMDLGRKDSRISPDSDELCTLHNSQNLNGTSAPEMIVAHNDLDVSMEAILSRSECDMIYNFVETVGSDAWDTAAWCTTDI